MLPPMMLPWHHHQSLPPLLRQKTRTCHTCGRNKHWSSGFSYPYPTPLPMHDLNGLLDHGAMVITASCV